MTKPRRRPTPPTMPTEWDTGAKGRANLAGLVVESPDTVNPNGIKRARRVDMIEVWHSRGYISKAGRNAAEKLRDAYETTLRAPGWSDNDRVDSSPKPDHAIAIQIDRLSTYIRISRYIHPDDRAIIEACVIRSGTPRAVNRQWVGARYDEGLRVLGLALDRLADRMGR